MDVRLLKKIAVMQGRQPAAREALNAFAAFGDDAAVSTPTTDFCSAAAAVWKQVTNDGVAADKYRLQCQAPMLGDPWTEIGRGARRLPWGWSSTLSFTQNPGPPSIFYSGALALAASAEDLIKKAVDAGASALDKAATVGVTAATNAVNNAVNNVTNKQPIVGKVIPTFYILTPQDQANAAAAKAGSGSGAAIGLGLAAAALFLLKR